MSFRASRKRALELRRNLINHHYEQTDAGVYFPKLGALASGEYVHDVNGMDEQVDKNILVNEGLMHLLEVALFNGTKIPTWYLALYSGNYTPVGALTAASFAATTGEIVSLTEGYTQATRRQWQATAPSNNIIDNLTNKAAYTIATASQLNVNGAALLSDQNRGSTQGVLMSASKFNATRVLYNTDVFNLAYRVQLTST